MSLQGIPQTLDSLFDSIGTKALQAVVVIIVLLTIVVGVMVATGGDASKIVDSLSRVIAIDWFFSGIQDLRAAITRASEAMHNRNLFALAVEAVAILMAMLATVAGLVRVVVFGYVDLATFAVNSVPPLVKPIGIFIAVALTFVQFCVVWVVAKFVMNMVSQLISIVTGR